MQTAVLSGVLGVQQRLDESSASPVLRHETSVLHYERAQAYQDLAEVHLCLPDELRVLEAFVFSSETRNACVKPLVPLSSTSTTRNT